jgi:energy-coupling factor transporter ATP-binding protein EcfA2
MKKDTVTFKDIEDIFDTFLLLADRDLIRITIAAVLGNQMMNRRPIWLMLVAPPSSGKTTALNALNGLKVTNKAGEFVEPIHSISDITENSFASGAQRSDGETSLLFKIPKGGVMVFKDFTSILSKNADAKRIVMGQLREVYDGSYVKRTGTGKDIKWEGKIGALAGVTESVYQHLESMSVMGDRFMLYQVPQPDRKKMLRFKLDQERSGKTEDVQMPIAKELVHAYMQRAYSNLSSVKVTLSHELEEEIIAVADFCTMVRSGIITNEYNGQIVFVPQPEMPARMFEQMLALGSTFAYMRKLDDPKLDDEDALIPDDLRIMYKIAFDSIPVTRRIALSYLVKFTSGVETSALATKINYPSPVVQAWLEQLNALGVVRRAKTSSGTNKWMLKPEYITLMEKLQGVKATHGTLADRDVDINDAPEHHWQKEVEQEKRFLTDDEWREKAENDENDF